MTTQLAIMFADIGGSSSLYRSVGDQQAHSQISQNLQGMRRDVENSGGQVLRTVGDAVLASFTSCDQALLAAQQIHKAQHGNLKVRIGFHWGEVIHDNGDVYGDAVNVAARVSDIAEVGEITLTETARSRLAAETIADAILLDLFSFKGLEVPIEVYRYQERAVADLTSVISYPAGQNDFRQGSDCQLHLIYGTTSASLSVSNTDTSIGRSNDSDIVINVPGVSKLHAKIECRRGRFVFIDCSTNGSFIVKNQEPYVFVHRDTITLDGSGSLHLGQPPEQAEIAAAIQFKLVVKARANSTSEKRYQPNNT
ncbi:MAG: adenylate/guanylate cyclase domain-containing protein [Pseudomonadales bacterium]